MFCYPHKSPLSLPFVFNLLPFQSSQNNTLFNKNHSSFNFNHLTHKFCSNFFPSSSTQSNMSGGVGPTCDISLPKEEQTQKSQTKKSIITPTKIPKVVANGLSITLRQLNSLAIMIVLATSGMVSFEDLFLVVFSIIYIYFLSKFAFPTHNNNSPIQQQPIFGQDNKILSLYILFAAIVGLFLPILFIFHGFVEGDTQGIKAAAPHVFLLASQVFMEGVSASDRFSLPIRVFVPVFYNSRRLFSLKDWLKEELMIVGEVKYGGSFNRLWIGRALAIANCMLWTYNLFGFLLPVYLPKAFKRYYSDNASTTSKKD